MTFYKCAIFLSSDCMTRWGSSIGEWLPPNYFLFSSPPFTQELLSSQVWLPFYLLCSCVRFFLHSHFPNSLSFTASSASHNRNHLAFLLPLTHRLLVSQPPPVQVLYLSSTSSSLSLLTSSVSHLSGQKLHLILSGISSS